jgi:hypothetical protein
MIYLPESQRWYAKQGSYIEARSTLEIIYEDDCVDNEENSLRIEMKQN